MVKDMKSYSDVLIVGSGHGGAQAAIVLRQRGFSGTIRIVTEEQEFPYERPPLSKEYLSQERSFDRMLIRSENFWAEKEVNFNFGHSIERIDPENRIAYDASGHMWLYGQMIWAAGGHARRLSCDGSNVAGLHTIRTRKDIDKLESELADASRVVIIGGGFIGLETAAILSKFGKKVTVIEAQDRVLARVAAKPISNFFEEKHRAHGVNFRLQAAVAEIEGRAGRVIGVRLEDDSTIPADIVIVGIGLEPSVTPLLQAGALGGNGVEVDEFCRTSLPNIYAIGDCAAHINNFGDGRKLRLESVQNAADQAITAALHILGQPQPYVSVPWFWSNQFEHRLQTVGLNIGYDSEVLRGDPFTGSFSIVYLRGGKVAALDCVNAISDYAQGKLLVQRNVEISPKLLADPKHKLKSFLL
ncbi:3-phenylpropionate/trans-cinnamate dioxygenase ferredoxin reductase subunit [Advenella incenata]|uniref:3-phenylpropionate/trans-cinnamate dioxygenase ferredoxin reductase subunit n=1 Tax=Advenella incenata TaxID=267800 RepID=A0A4Q7VFT4_9BURK|nr:FAD-dependent oxidoreductase [Advenella incenata]RZT94852.1 3-phenylpropionate/trans-cinnamate dioxygenase ferredoxin reductase subunit [Advenella incenata]